RVRVPPHYTVMLDVKLVGLDNAQKRDGSWIVGDSGNGYLKGTGGLHQSLSPHKSFCEVRIDRCNPHLFPADECRGGGQRQLIGSPEAKIHERRVVECTGFHVQRQKG